MIIEKNLFFVPVTREDKSNAEVQLPTAFVITETGTAQQRYQNPSWAFSFHQTHHQTHTPMSNPPKLKWHKMYFDQARFLDLINDQYFEEETESIRKLKEGKKVQVIEWDLERQEPTGRLWLGEVSRVLERMFHLGILRAVIVRIDRLPAEANYPKPLPP